MKETHYFRHDYNAHGDEKILKLRLAYPDGAGYGIFWMILEKLAESSEGRIELKNIDLLAFDLHLDSKRTADVILSYNLFQTDDTYFWSNRLLSDLKERSEKSKNAILANRIRWDKERVSIQTDSSRTPFGIPIKEIKKRKERDICPASPDPTPSVIEEFNRLTGAGYRLTPDKRRQVRERLKSFSREDVTRAILNRLNDRNSMGANPTGKVWAREWNSLFRNDANFDRALNLAGSVVIDDAFYQKEMSELGVVKFKAKYGESLALKFYKFSSL